jgi:hypothetical protein
MISTLAEIKTLPGVLMGSAHRNVPATMLLSMTIAGMMGLGFAGSPALETYIKAGMLLWLMHLGLVHLLAWHGASRYLQGRQRPLFDWLTLLSPTLMGMGSVILWWTDPDRVRLMAYMLGMWISMSALLLLHARWERRPDQTPSGR